MLILAAFTVTLKAEGITTTQAFVNRTDSVVGQEELAAHFPGVNNTTVWSDPRSGSHIEFSSFAHLARTAERAKMDFLFLAEGLRLREQGGLIHDLDVAGRSLAVVVKGAGASEVAAMRALSEVPGVARPLLLAAGPDWIVTPFYPGSPPADDEPVPDEPV